MDAANLIHCTWPLSHANTWQRGSTKCVQNFALDLTPVNWHALILGCCLFSTHKFFLIVELSNTNRSRMITEGRQASFCIALKLLAIILEELMKQGLGRTAKCTWWASTQSPSHSLSHIIKTSELSSFAKGSSPHLSCDINICAGIHFLLVLQSEVASLKLRGGLFLVRLPTSSFAWTAHSLPHSYIHGSLVWSD